jgi:hypothetical protein
LRKSTTKDCTTGSGTLGLGLVSLNKGP